MSDAGSVETSKISVLAVAVPTALTLLSITLILLTLQDLNDFNAEAYRVPLGMLSGIAVLSGASAIFTIRQVLTTGWAPPDWDQILPGAGFLGLAFVFVVLMGFTGFLATGIVLFPLAARIAGSVTVVPAALCAFGVPLAIYGAFGWFFSIWLPTGVLFGG